MGKAFAPERLMHIRRLRKARRLFKRKPLFAFEEMRLAYPQYTYDEFLDDLRRRTPRKNRQPKSPLPRYGRYVRMQQLLDDYKRRGDTDALWMAVQLRERMTKPYRVSASIGHERIEFTFSPMISMGRIEQLTADIRKCSSMEQVLRLVEQFRKTERFN